MSSSMYLHTNPNTRELVVQQEHHMIYSHDKYSDGNWGFTLVGQNSGKFARPFENPDEFYVRIHIIEYFNLMNVVIGGSLSNKAILSVDRRCLH